MLTPDDLASFRGATVEDAEIHERTHGQVLRLRLRGGGIVAISVDDHELHVSDETSIP